MVRRNTLNVVYLGSTPNSSTNRDISSNLISRTNLAQVVEWQTHWSKKPVLLNGSMSSSLILGTNEINLDTSQKCVILE